MKQYETQPLVLDACAQVGGMRPREVLGWAQGARAAAWGERGWLSFGLASACGSA